MQRVMDLVTSTGFGRVAHKTVSPLIHLLRRISNPDISNDHIITRVAYRGRTFNLEHRRWSQDDALAIKQCFTQAQYDMPTGAHGVLVENLYQEIVASGLQPLIIDCGANIGASVAWFSTRYPEAHIIAVEPAAENFALLRRNCAGLDVDLRHAGISSTDGRAYLDNSSGCHMGFRTTSERRGVEIDLVSVGSLLASKPASAYAPFLLKVDIEGAEKNLFDGDTDPINRFPLIILEPHDWLMPGQHTSQEFFRFHAASGREFCMKHENVASIVPHSSLLQMTTGLKN
ncbi:MAG TPA: FkbM family methyltransferase [Edaphobacter sp.]|nr:FkbM family methyltransferase [Edaphobacter sp.]